MGHWRSWEAVLGAGSGPGGAEGPQGAGRAGAGWAATRPGGAGARPSRFLQIFYKFAQALVSAIFYNFFTTRTVFTIFLHLQFFYNWVGGP